MDMDLDGEVQYDFFPFIRQYKSGRVVRFGATDTVPAGTDDTAAGIGVTSKDVVINPSSGLWARLYLPSALPSAGRQDKLPVVVYYHGGAFVIGSTANRPTHEYLNRLAADANVLIVSPEYRLAPEHPLPTAHDDSWEALRWVASHATTTWEGPAEPWLVEHGDLTRVFLAGVSAGGNIAHNMAERAGAQSRLGVPVRGLLLVHPYFTGGEATDTARKARSEAMWRYVCPGTTTRWATRSRRPRVGARRVSPPSACSSASRRRTRSVAGASGTTRASGGAATAARWSCTSPWVRGMSSITATRGATKRGCCRRASSVRDECASESRFSSVPPYV
jgi:acetyl esterase/lipase